MLVCVDTHILIWGIRGVASPGQEEMIERTGLLLEELDEKQSDIIVPSVVIGEFLLGVPANRYKDVMSVFERRFQIVPYDGLAAIKAAEIWIEKNRGSAGITEELREGLENSRRVKLKDDCKIVATAVRYKADCIYSEDEGVQKFGKDFIDVHPVPRDLMKQEDLFDSSRKPIRKIRIRKPPKKR